MINSLVENSDYFFIQLFNYFIISGIESQEKQLIYITTQHGFYEFHHVEFCS